MSPRLPDFIIAGAPRSGTTWLYWLLDRHPQVYMAQPVRPEPKFFLMDEEYAKGLDYYRERWFAGAGQALACGEKSTNYLERAVVAERIRTHLPGVRLIFILRDPVQRAYSNYLWSRMNGLEPLSFAEALEAEPAREQNVPAHLRYARPHAYFSRGLYADLLAPYFERFAREQMLFLRFEDIADAQGARRVAERLHRFLGVPGRPADADGLGPVNAAEPAEPLPASVRDRLQASYAEPNQRLAALLGAEFTIWDAA